MDTIAAFFGALFSVLGLTWTLLIAGVYYLASCEGPISKVGSERLTMLAMHGPLYFVAAGVIIYLGW